MVYNNAFGLEKSIKNLLSQTYKNVEYIVIDGGSTDGTVDVIRQYGKNISKWSRPVNVGVSPSIR